MSVQGSCRLKSLIKIDSSRLVNVLKYCAVKRLKDVVKLKLRTARRLYTLKVEPVKAEELIKKLQCEIREI